MHVERRILHQRHTPEVAIWRLKFPIHRLKQALGSFHIPLPPTHHNAGPDVLTPMIQMVVSNFAGNGERGKRPNFAIENGKTIIFPCQFSV